jgi:very-short-patch-repair endonuclease
LLNSWSLDAEQPESVLEAKMLSLCYSAGFPSFEFQASVGPYRVDFLWREQMAIVECDGFAFHGSTRDAFERDRLRDAYLQSLGFTVWRFSFRQLTFQQNEVRERLRSIFRRNV